MSQTIKKISDLTNVESFLQINLFKGYKYIDKAGEIVNYFHKEKEVPRFTMDLNGLTIINPEEKIETLKISSNVFWAHFPLPDSLEIMDDYFGKKAEDILKILEIKEVSRIGWRNYFVYEYSTEENRDKIFEKFIPIKDLSFEEIVVSTKCEDKKLTIRIRKVKKNDDSKTFGVLFDVDFYENFTNLLPTEKIPLKLNEFKKTIRSETFIKMLNEILINKNG